MRHLRTRLATLLVGATLMAACSTAPPVPSPTSAASAVGTPSASGTPVGGSTPAVSTAPTRAATQDALRRTFAAAVAGDRRTWDAGTATLDAAFAVRADLLFTNLRAVRPARLDVRLTGAQQAVPAARRAVLGPGAQVVQARLAWRLAGERADAVSSVWLTVVPGPVTAPGRVRLAGTDDGSSLDQPGVPLWWLAPVARRDAGDVTVLVGPGQAAARWLGLATRAAAAVRRQLPGPQRRGWDGRLVVEVPATEADLARLLGAGPTAYATTAAVTRPEGPTTGAAVRVVVNPATARDGDVELGTTLTHETVHVATGSSTSPAPLWAVEGLAEYVALRAHPDQRASETAALRSAPLPARLPPDPAFTAGGKDVTAAYAQAWLACATIAEHRSPTDLGRFYAELGRGRTVDRAARSTLGVGQGGLEGWWRDAVRRAAAGRG